METLKFIIDIDATVEIVYNTMLDKATFRQWTAVFNPDSHYEGSWEKGSEIYFLATEEDGTKSGMVSRIKENRPNEFVSIEHQGVVKHGKEIQEGKSTLGFAGAMENYHFTAKGTQTEVRVEAEVPEEWKEYFTETWPKALEKLKAICENRTL